MNKTYLLLLFLMFSTITLSQNVENNENQQVNIEQISNNELGKLDDFLHLSQEQKEQVYEIIHGVLIKNKQVKLMKLIEEDKKAIIMRNEESKSLMIMDVLVGKQRIAYENHLNTLINPEGSAD